MEVLRINNRWWVSQDDYKMILHLVMLGLAIFNLIMNYLSSFVMFVVLMHDSMLLTNQWAWLNTWCNLQFYCDFHLLKLVIFVLLI